MNIFILCVTKMIPLCTERAVQAHTSGVTCTKSHSWQNQTFLTPDLGNFVLLSSGSHSLLSHANHQPNGNVKVSLPTVPTPGFRGGFQRSLVTRQKARPTWVYLQTVSQHRNWPCYRHILAGNKVACLPKCLLLHFITGGEEPQLCFIGP